MDNDLMDILLGKRLECHNLEDVLKELQDLRGEVMYLRGEVSRLRCEIVDLERGKI